MCVCVCLCFSVLQIVLYNAMSLLSVQTGFSSEFQRSMHSAPRIGPTMELCQHSSLRAAGSSTTRTAQRFYVDCRSISRSQHHRRLFCSIGICCEARARNMCCFLVILASSTSRDLPESMNQDSIRVPLPPSSFLQRPSCPLCSHTLRVPFGTGQNECQGRSLFISSAVSDRDREESILGLQPQSGGLQHELCRARACLAMRGAFFPATFCRGRLAGHSADCSGLWHVHSRCQPLLRPAEFQS